MREGKPIDRSAYDPVPARQIILDRAERVVQAAGAVALARQRQNVPIDKHVESALAAASNILEWLVSDLCAAPAAKHVAALEAARMALGARAESSAKELAWARKVAVGLKPLSDGAQKVLAVLYALPLVEARTEKQLSKTCNIPEGRIRDSIKKELEPYGVRNRRGGIGYYILSGHRAVVRIALAQP